MTVQTQTQTPCIFFTLLLTYYNVIQICKAIVNPMAPTFRHTHHTPRMLKTQYVKCVMAFLMQPSFKFESPAQHTRLLIPIPND